MGLDEFRQGATAALAAHCLAFRQAAARGLVSRAARMVLASRAPRLFRGTL
jgi:hypothetical protein